MIEDAYKDSDDVRPYQLIRSYPLNKWCVSTAYRRSSARTESPPWYFETGVWEIEEGSNKRTNLIAMVGSGSFKLPAISSHMAICADLIEHGEVREEEY